MILITGASGYVGSEVLQQAVSAGLQRRALLDLQLLHGASLVDPIVERIIGRKATTFDQFARDYATAFQPSTREKGV